MLNTLFTKQYKFRIISLFTGPLKCRHKSYKNELSCTASSIFLCTYSVCIVTTVTAEDYFPVTAEFYYHLITFWSENSSELTFNHFPMDTHTQFKIVITVLIKKCSSFSANIKQAWHLKLPQSGKMLHDRTKIQQQHLRKTWHWVTQTFWIAKTGLGFLAL